MGTQSCIKCKSVLAIKVNALHISKELLYRFRCSESLSWSTYTDYIVFFEGINRYYISCIDTNNTLDSSGFLKSYFKRFCNPLCIAIASMINDYGFHSYIHIPPIISRSYLVDLTVRYALHCTEVLDFLSIALAPTLCRLVTITTPRAHTTGKLFRGLVELRLWPS